MSDTSTLNGKGKPDGEFPFELNGEKLFAPYEKLLPLQILEIAWEMKILPFESDKYVLVSAEDGSVYKDEDYVHLQVDNHFIAQPTTSATVAMEPAHVDIAR